MNLAQEWLLDEEEMGRREDLNDSEWLKKWFVKIFEKSKNFDPETKEKIEKLEKKH